MQETKDPKSVESAGADKSPETMDPKSDATSAETLSDVVETEKDETTETGGDDVEPSPVPSPDGAFDEGRGGNGGLEDAGPM
jgi:hypothetical protein